MALTGVCVGLADRMVFVAGGMGGVAGVILRIAGRCCAVAGVVGVLAGDFCANAGCFGGVVVLRPKWVGRLADGSSMRTVPINNGPFLEWVNLVAPAWVEHAWAIGVDISDAQAFAADAQRVEQLNMQMIQARNAARTATQAYTQAQRALRASAAGIVKQVRLKASEASTPQQAVEITGLARLELAPQSGPELPPPSAPDEVRIALGATMGNVTLKIKARQPVNARGTVYQVTREARIAGGQVRRDILGVATTKTFTDTTIPPGTVEARYLLTALRAGKTGGTREAVVRLAA